jgi:hypothetical protein
VVIYIDLYYGTIYLCDRFRVKVEVTDGGSSAVFVIFDSEMSYVMENSCAYFVSRAKVNNCYCFGFCLDHQLNLFIDYYSFHNVSGLQWQFSSKRIRCISWKEDAVFCSEISYIGSCYFFL